MFNSIDTNELSSVSHPLEGLQATITLADEHIKNLNSHHQLSEQQRVYRREYAT